MWLLFLLLFPSLAFAGPIGWGGSGGGGGDGITAINGLTAATQTLAVGTAGTDIVWSSVTSTHTLNVPIASAVNTGKLSSTDWTAFDAKLDSADINVQGTANEIASSGSGATPVLSLPVTIDLGGKTSLEIPNSAAPVVDAFGEIAADNDLWAAGRGAPVFFDGTAAIALVGVLTSDVPTNGQVPTWNTGGTITWESAGAGAGDITDVYNCSTGDCSSIALADGDLLDMSGVVPSTTTEGIRLPQGADCSPMTAAGQLCWDTGGILTSGNGSEAKIIGRDLMVYLPPAQWTPELTNGPNIVTIDGTNFDYLVLAFDQTTQECATAQFGNGGDKLGAVFGIRVHWTAAAGTAAQTLELDFSFFCSANDEVLDAAAVATVAVTDSLIATGDTHFASATVAHNCTAGEMVVVRMCRDVVADNLAADARILNVSINPRY